MHRRFQFGMRENPASDRRHGSRFALNTRSNETIEEESRMADSPSSQNHPLANEGDNYSHAASIHAATGGTRQNKNNLLNVREVAELLSVPKSWVYGRMRMRALDRIPAYRVGKYWRFRADEVMAWLHDSRRQSESDQMA